MKWIAIRKKMPRYGERVLVCDDTGKIFLEEREDVNHVQLGKMSWLKSWKFGNGTRLVAWMPLPTPPKKLCKFMGEEFSYFNSPLVGPWDEPGLVGKREDLSDLFYLADRKTIAEQRPPH